MFCKYFFGIALVCLWIFIRLANHGMAEDAGYRFAQTEIRSRYLGLLFHLQIKRHSESNAPDIDKGVQNQIRG
jgi:hypothetical protein